MRKERKLRRLDFDLIQAEMSVIDGELLRSIVGGYNNDCFWRCIAYIEHGGCYTKSDVEGYAESYFGPGVNLNERKDGAAVDTIQMKEFVTNKYGSSSSSSGYDKNNDKHHLIIQFDLKKAGMEVESTDTHTVLFRKDVERDGISYIKVYDPQKNEEYEIPKSAWVASILVDKNDSNKGSGSDNGSSNGGSGSDSGSSNGGSGSGSSSYYGSSNYGSGSSSYGSGSSSYYGSSNYGSGSSSYYG